MRSAVAVVLDISWIFEKTWIIHWMGKITLDMDVEMKITKFHSGCFTKVLDNPVDLGANPDAGFGMGQH